MLVSYEIISRILHGTTMEFVDYEAGIDNVYYYLISNENACVASLLISYNNGEYGFQVSKTDYASGINKVARNDSYVM